MMREQTNKRFVELCKSYDIDIVISNIDCKDAPKYKVSDSDGVYTIVLNDSKIEQTKYDTLLAYAVSRVLLPKLIIKTERLVIRRFHIDDANDCFSFMSDENGMYLDGCKPFYKMDEEYWERMKLFERRDGQYVIVLKSTNKVIGTINVFADDTRAVDCKEIGYTINPSHQRNGYAFEAISAILDLLQNKLLFDMVVAGVLPDNIPSIKLLEKLGFSREGIRHKALWHEGLNRPVDLIYYYIDR